MIGSTNHLPNHYVPTLVVDYDKNQKLNRRLLIMAIVLFIGLFLLGNTYLPIYLMGYDAQGQFLPIPVIGLKVGILVIIFVFYTLIHEKIRGILMKRFSGRESSLEFRGSTAFAKSEGFFSKRDFRIISLGPVLILAFLIFLVTIILPMDWFWVGFIAQILNLAGSLKDFYGAWQGIKQPADVLIQDNGQVQTFYTPDLERLARSVHRSNSAPTSSRSKQNKKIYPKKKK
ncbi:MAG: DUF3267 domain-containing protein [Clostridiaceae bacterium]